MPFTLLRASAPRALRCASTARITAFSSARSFQTTARVTSGKESELHDETRPSRAEQEKQDQLRKVKESGQGEWKEGLASDSESNVKADRENFASSKESIGKLQQEAKEKAERENKEGKR